MSGAEGTVLVWRRLAPARWADAWEERLLGAGAGQVVVHTLSTGKSIRLEVYGLDEAGAERLTAGFGGVVRRVAVDSWMAAGARGLRPVRIRDRLIVTHSRGERERFEREYPRREILCIPAGMAFGTGDHATTASCLRLLVDAMEGGARVPGRVLDLGTGSGILAIAAARLGARPVTGIDNDPGAVAVARANANENGVGHVRFRAGEAGGVRGAGDHAVILANLFSTALEASAPDIRRLAAPGGTVIVSGILRDQEADTLRALAGDGALDVVRVIRRGKWVAATLLRRDKPLAP